MTPRVIYSSARTSEHVVRAVHTIGDCHESTQLSAYTLWLTRRRQGRLPGIEDFDVNVAGYLGFLRQSHVFDVTPEDPLRYNINVFAPIEFAGGMDLWGRPLADMPWQQYAECAADDYYRAKSSREPVFSRIEAHLGPHRHSYSRLLLPLSRDRRSVTDVLTVVRSYTQEVFGEARCHVHAG